MKKLFAMIMVSIFTLFATTSCKSVSKPTYNSDKEYEIGMWVGVSDKITTYDENGNAVSSRMMTDQEFLEKYQDIKDSGINIAFPGYGEMHDGGNYNQKALKAAFSVNIKQIIADASLKNTLLNAKTLIESEVKTETQVVEEVKNIIKPYTESQYSSALYGFMIQDEPDVSKFGVLGFAEAIFKKAAPNLMFYVNLFPVIAGGTQLSGSATPILYNQYLAQWFSSVKLDYVSYDHYPLYGNGFDTSIESSFLYNMDLMQSKIKEECSNRKLWTFLQSIQFGARNRALKSKADASFQVYSFIAYGGKGIQWFCYAAPPSNDGNTFFENNSLVTRDFEKTITYEYVSSVNKDVHGLNKYLDNFEWKGIKISSVFDDTENFSYIEDSEFIIQDKKLISFNSTEDAFAGIYEDKDGNNGYMVVNFTDPAKQMKNTITMKFEGSSMAIVVIDGKETIKKLKNGVLTLNMNEGDGYFVIPY